MSQKDQLVPPPAFGVMIRGRVCGGSKDGQVMQRKEILAELAGKPLDVLVVGGGILGSGVARDAAMRGLRTGLVDQHDFAFGTSSRSSRLLHGGLRYLAQGRVGLVREAGREKAVLTRIALHLAGPLAFIFPTYAGTDWPRWQLSLGVRIYDLLCGVPDAPRSGTISVERTLEMLPQLNREGLTGSVRYGDGLTNDARLVVDTLVSAARSGAMLLNYAVLNRAARRGDVWVCEVEDREGAGAIEIRAKVVVNTAGPWAGGIPNSQIGLRLTKGVHLVIGRERLPIPDAVVMAEGKRILFAIPFGERVILGTTDTDFEGRPEDVKTDARDVEYILKVANQTFVGAKLTPEDVISDWAGIRPLIAKGDGSPSDISRRHLILSTPEGWVDVAGGKLTTYRHIAKEAVDRVLQVSGLSARECRTHLEPLLPEEQATRVSGITPPPMTRDLVEHFVGNEWALHLEDVMSRRGRWDTYNTDPIAIAGQVAEMMGQMLGWTQERKSSELLRWRRSASEFLRG